MRVLLTALLLLSACGGPRKVLVRPQYVILSQDNVHDVLVTGDKALEEAKKELGCGVCTTELKGFYWVIVTPKKD